MNIDPDQRTFNRVIFIGNYMPSQCGIATFMTDLCENLSNTAADMECQAIVVNDNPGASNYPQRVCFEIQRAARRQYDIAADFINLHRPDAVCLQHEYGIFGGRAGRYILPLLRQIRVPIVTTLHTVLRDPDEDQKQVMRTLIDLSDRLVVMSHRGAEFLKEIYGAPEEKIAFIPHGIPDVSFIDPNFYKDKFNADGRPMLLTFGLLSPNKGIEFAIESLPKVVEKFPDVLYMVLGATHPQVRREHDEQYRHGLMRQVEQLGLGNNVQFVNRFVSSEELQEYLGAADIYLTPYLNERQITSGTLAYAVGTGKATVSTPYWYAEELLAEGRGRLVGFRDTNELSNTIIDLLENEADRHAMRKRAYQYGRSMTWPNVASQYLKLFETVRDERRHSPRPRYSTPAQTHPHVRFDHLPSIDPRHLLTMTDDTGIIQHALYSVPDWRFGYSADDQARALIVAVKAMERDPDAAQWEMLASRYLAFLCYCFDEDTGRFRNFMNYQRQWIDPPATEDVHGRCIWALAHVVALAKNQGRCNLAAQLMQRAVESAVSFEPLRACAFVILGIQKYLRRFSGATNFRREREVLATRTYDEFKKNATEDWPWPEDTLTYTCAHLPHALIEAGQWMPHNDMVEMGLKSLQWLCKVQTEDDHFVPIGSNGWYKRGGHRARFDQQPVEVPCTMDACLAAYRVTRDEKWLHEARRAFEWFLGRNDLAVSMYDYTTGGSFDGLRADHVNQNQGAESVISWLNSLLLMYELEEEIEAQQSPKSRPTTAEDQQSLSPATVS